MVSGAWRDGHVAARPRELPLPVLAEREEIALLRAEGKGVREIAREIGRSPSTISRELRRNAAIRSGRLEYRASVAQWKAELMASRAKTAKLVDNQRLRAYVQDRLAGAVCLEDGTPVAGPVTKAFQGRNKPHRQDRRWASAWSPQQISERLKLDFPDDRSMRISHEAIYQALDVQGRGALKRELVACLGTGRALRVPRARARQRPGGHVTAEVMISQRPSPINSGIVPPLGLAVLATLPGQRADDERDGCRVVGRDLTEAQRTRPVPTTGPGAGRVHRPATASALPCWPSRPGT